MRLTNDGEFEIGDDGKSNGIGGGEELNRIGDAEKSIGIDDGGESTEIGENQPVKIHAGEIVRAWIKTEVKSKIFEPRDQVS